MKKTGSSIPTDKGKPRPPSAEQGQAAGGFQENHPRGAAVFSRKTLHSRDTAPCRGRWNGIPGIHIHKRQVIWI